MRLSYEIYDDTLIYKSTSEFLLFNSIKSNRCYLITDYLWLLIKLKLLFFNQMTDITEFKYSDPSSLVNIDYTKYERLRVLDIKFSILLNLLI